MFATSIFFAFPKTSISSMMTTALLVMSLSIIDSTFAAGVSTTEQDKIRSVFNAMFDHLEDQYLHRQDYDFASLRKETIAIAIKEESFESALLLSSGLFDRIQCNHCQIFYEDKHVASSLNKQLSQEDFSAAFLLEYQENPSFSVAVLDSKYGYVNMPGMLLIDLTTEALNQTTQEMYDAIADIAERNEIIGWLIDLRVNIGGNAYPMITALHYLLGDRVVYGVKDREGTIISTQRLKEGAFFVGDDKVVQVNAQLEPNTDTPEALLTSKLTASAGENVAIAFTHRSNSLVIGQPSYGHLTANELIDLSYGVQFALTSGYIVDEVGDYRPTIEPDISTDKQDNFVDFLLDENVKMAIDFFKTVNRSQRPL